MESMRTLPSSVQTLPPDGLVLEELISTMQTEYGTPTTPQEYRLIVKVPIHEEPAGPMDGDKETRLEPGDPENEDPAVRPNRSTRRRRRGRRRTGVAAGEGDADMEAVLHGVGADQEGAEDSELKQTPAQ